jgi:dipeptidyl-peptidase-4
MVTVLQNKFSLSITTIIFLCLLIILSGSFAQNQDTVALNLKSIYTDHIFSLEDYGPVRFLEEGKGYTTLETAPSGEGKDLIRYDCQSGKREILVSANRLIPAGERKPLDIKDYQWSADGTKLLIFTNTRKVWRRHTRGDYWVLNLKNWQLRRLGKQMEPATLMFAKFSSDGKKVGFVNKQNIFVEDLETDNIIQLTKDGGDFIINGTFDWVYEEELDCRDGFRWSPDSKYIAYWQINTEGIGTFYLINNIDSIYSTPIPLPYPKVGTKNPAAKIGIISAEGGKTNWLNIPGDQRNFYLARMDFTASSDEIVIQQLNRWQNTNKVMLTNIHSGDIKVVVVEQDSAWVDVTDDLHWLMNGNFFIWSSERDGWRHLYLISRDGKTIEKITKGAFDIIRLIKIDEENDYVYYLASPDNPTEAYLFRSRLDGKGKAERITPPDQIGHHEYQISPDSKWAIHTFQNHRTPDTIDFISLPDHQRKRILQDNGQLKKKYVKLNIKSKEFFRLEIEKNILLDAWMIKPVTFDPDKKYPLIFYVYGEPASSTVQNKWNRGELFHHYLAQRGYIIMSVDNRGTNMPRGRKWRKSIYKQVGILASLDQKAAAETIIRRFDFVDKDRIGIWGWSGGGSMTLNCLFRFPKIYKTGVAIAFISDQKLYDTIHQERYMNLPENNEFGYRDGSPITYAHNLQGNLLLIHGTADDNCHYQNCEMLADELIKHNKMFSMMTYPMRTHSIRERENSSRHLRETLVQFFLKNLEPGPKLRK